MLLPRSTEAEEKFSSQYTAGNVPSAVEAVVLNRCMPTDADIYTVVKSAQILLLKLRLVGRWAV